MEREEGFEPREQAGTAAAEAGAVPETETAEGAMTAEPGEAAAEAEAAALAEAAEQAGATEAEAEVVRQDAGEPGAEAVEPGQVEVAVEEAGDEEAPAVEDAVVDEPAETEQAEVAVEETKAEEAPAVEDAVVDEPAETEQAEVAVEETEAEEAPAVEDAVVDEPAETEQAEVAVEETEAEEAPVAEEAAAAEATAEEPEPADALTVADAPEPVPATLEGFQEPLLSDPADPGALPAEPAAPEILPPDEGDEVEPEPVEYSDAELQAILEAVIYVTEEPLEAKQIAAALRQPLIRIQAGLDALIAEHARPERGLQIKEIAGGYKMATKAELHDSVRLFVKNLKPPLKLSLAALETLAVIAYKQPITAPEIMEIRGVQGGGVLKTLLDRKLVAVAGRKNVIGKPILYKTTKDFLIQFGLSNLKELPSLKEFEELRRLAFSEEEAEATVEALAEQAAETAAAPAPETQPATAPEPAKEN